MESQEQPRYGAKLQAIIDCIPARYPLLRLALIPQFGLFFVALAVMWLTGRPFPSFACRIPLWQAVLMVLASEFGVIGALVLFRKIFQQEIKFPSYIERLMQALRRTSPRDLVLTCTIIGFCEEFAFRGILAPLVGGRSSALLFGLAHRPKVALHWFTLTTLGFIFWWEAKVTGGLLIPMVHHALHDLVALSIFYVSLKHNPDMKMP